MTRSDVAQAGVRRLVEKLREAAAQSGHYGAWSHGVLMEQAADKIEQLDKELDRVNLKYGIPF